MQLPRAELLRPEPSPDDLLLVVRGGATSLSDAHVARQVGDCWEKYGFFGVSVFGAFDDDLTVLNRHVRALRVRPVVRVARCGVLREAGFEVMPTFSNRYHFSVVLPDATPETFATLRRCFGDALPNPGHEPEK